MTQILNFIDEYQRYTYAFIAFFVAFFGYSIFLKSIDGFLRNTLPSNISLHLNNHDPYIKSLFSENKLRNEIDKIKKLIKGFLSFVFILIFCILIFSLFNSSSQEYSIEETNNANASSSKKIEFGPFGDLFNGILTPLLTFSSFVFLLFTVVIQNIQMRATLTELQMSRLEMSESTDALQAQVKNFNAQKFDNILFSLIDNYKILIKDLREQKFFDEKRNVIDVPYESYIFNKINKLDFISLESFWGKVKDDFLPIFLLNYQMLKYIDANIDLSISKIDAKRYVGIIRAITPKNILFLIYINCALSDFNKYKQLLEKYSVFEHLYFTGTHLGDFKKLSSVYDISSFGDGHKLLNYIESNPSSINLFLAPIEKFNNKVKSFDISNFSWEEKSEFSDFAEKLKERMLAVYRAEVLNKKQSVLKICINSSENFYKFCTNDISILIEYKYKIESLHQEAILLIDNEYKRLSACPQ